MLKRNIALFIIVSVLVATITSCDRSKKYEREENEIIQGFLNSNPNLDFILQPSGLYYFSYQEGTGMPPVKHDTAWIMYTGKFLDGHIFDSNVGSVDTLILPVDEGWMLVKGFDEGITLMKAGEKAMLLLPSYLAFGPSGYNFINGYTPLLFDIQIIKIKRGSGK